MPTCIVLSLSDKQKLLDLARAKSEGSWTELASRLGCSKSLVFAYTQKTKISRRNFFRLCELAGLVSTEFEYTTINVKNEPRIVTLPKALNLRLSELLGILAGDGHVSTLKYQIHICGHKRLDREYIIGHVVPLVTSLFGTFPFIRENKATVYCRFYSKLAVLFLSSRFGIPLGKKKGRLRIPVAIRSRRSLLIAYLRGLFDTDGSIYRHHKHSLALDITSVSPNFRKDVLAALMRLGFHPVNNGKNIQLYHQSEIHRFFALVKPANDKHLIKYRTYSSLGYLPRASEIFAAVV